MRINLIVTIFEKCHENYAAGVVVLIVIVTHVKALSG
jgi:hypothetical protein